MARTTLPDGRPVTVTIVFENEQVTLTGTVPTGEAADRLDGACSRPSPFPGAVTNNLIIDPNTPTSGGVRIVELNSIHFVDDSARSPPITPHRSIASFQPWPRSRTAMVHVVGNTDLRGEETRNYVVSQRRAEAVVGYLVAQGIDPQRLTTQPAGESNPLSTEATPTADALNRRTDYVIFGLLDD